MNIGKYLQGLVLIALGSSCGPGELDGPQQLELANHESAVTATVDHRPFTVMTYNVRQVNADDTGAYTWTRRSPNVIKLISARNPDIFGVQEASATVIQNDLINAFQASYDYYKPPNGSPKMIFYRRSRFQLAAGTDVQGYFSIPNPYSASDACYPNASGRTASWIKLDDKLSGRQYFLVNSHPAHSGACGLAREKNAEQIRTVITEKALGRSVVVFGDFNSDPQHPSWAGDTSISILESEGSPALFRSARHTGETTDDTATFNSSWKSPSTSYTRLDYILVSGGDMTTSDPLIDRSTYDGITPSDHFAVMATIRPAVFQTGSTVDTHGSGSSASTRLYFADVTGDGCADKLAWNPTLLGGATQVFRSNCNGTFGTGVVNDNGESASTKTTFYFADVNGDRCADKIYWNPTYDTGHTRIYLSNCDGTFRWSNSNDNGGSESSATTFYFADLTGDQCADKIYWNPTYDSGRARIYLSNCDGTFRWSNTNTDTGSSQNSDAHFYFADVTGDGRADKILWDPAAESGRTRIYASNGNGTFTALSTHTGGSSGVPETRLYFTDVNGDGHADKLFWRPNYREGRIQVYLGSATGFAGAPLMDNTGWSQSSNTEYLFADLDGSGAADKVYWNPGANDGGSRAYLSRY
ncbi:endonuclease/exonuclease/phosphatase family protein [Archangium violaceum]|uniref:FG-GAP-like repeat-containing protein n=1 Tax=Archangium violaceum TaxID=83451 RepID=UPI0019523C30|nr:FG-GAP-like repeat-containing protein [Archangium violaceum]QRO02143.1 endonuclease/exonuclease/phosphatase family protein [Archangium violaceum]